MYIYIYIERERERYCCMYCIMQYSANVLYYTILHNMTIMLGYALSFCHSILYYVITYIVSSHYVISLRCVVHPVSTLRFSFFELAPPQFLILRLFTEIQPLNFLTRSFLIRKPGVAFIIIVLLLYLLYIIYKHLLYIILNIYYYIIFVLLLLILLLLLLIS